MTRSHDHARNEAASDRRADRFVRVVPGVAVAVITIVLAANADLSLHPAAIAFGLVAGLALQVAVNLRMAAFGLVVLLHASAYAVGLSTALERGITLGVVSVSSQGVFSAIVAQICFWLAVGVSTWAFMKVGERFLGEEAGDPVHARATHVGLGVVLLVSLVVAFRTGSWTAYGGDVGDGASEIGFKLEFLYEFALASSVLACVYAILQAVGARRPVPMWLWMLLAVLVSLVLFRQVRRLIIQLTVASALFAFDSVGARRRLLANPVRTGLVVGAVGLMLAGMFYVSEAWRLSSQEFLTNDVSARVADVYAKGLDEAGPPTVDVRERLTYLWLDGLTMDVAPALEGLLTLDEIFWRTVVVFVPGYIYPSKYLYPSFTCETAMKYIPLDTDLPCTPVSEGFLSSGWLGVALVGFSWGPVMAAASVLWRRRSPLARIAATHLALPMAHLETSAFPFVGSLRVALLAALAVWLVGLTYRWLAGGGRRATPAPA